MRQVIPGKAVDTVEAIGQISEAATVATVVASVILQTVVSGCLAQIWGMINGMSFMMHIPTLNIDFPSNAFLIISNVLLVVTFDIPYLNMGTLGPIFNFPDEDNVLVNDDQTNIRASFSLLCYGSAYMSNNLGSIFLYMLAMVYGLFLYVILDRFTHPFIVRLSNKIKDYFIWNYVIRLVIETYMQLCFCVYL